jgi:hypothetical protein
VIWKFQVVALTQVTDDTLSDGQVIVGLGLSLPRLMDVVFAKSSFRVISEATLLGLAKANAVQTTHNSVRKCCFI